MMRNLFYSFLALILILTGSVTAFAQSSGLSEFEKSFIFESQTRVKYLSKWRMQQIEGRAAPLIAVVIMQSSRMVVQRWVSTSVAKRMAARGAADLWAPTAQSARAIAKVGSRGGRPIREFSAGTGQRFTHYHTNPRNRRHVWYGSARQYGFAIGTTWGAFSGQAQAGYDENRIDCGACHRSTSEHQLAALTNPNIYNQYADYAVNTKFMTWKDQRDEGIVKQQFDYTCGAASVATILTYFYNHPIAEADVLTKLEDEELYSFDDLSQVVATLGFKAIGLSLSFSDLKKLKIPTVAHLHYRGQDHFTVIRGINDDGTVRLADSAFGNRRMREAEFKKYWEQDAGGSVLVVIPQDIVSVDISTHYFGDFDTFKALTRSDLFDEPLTAP